MKIAVAIASGTSEADRKKFGKVGNMAIAFRSSAGDRTAVVPQQRSVP